MIEGMICLLIFSVLTTMQLTRDVPSGIKALGYNVSKVKVLIHQFVTILKDGEVVKMSTRKANYITLDELIDEVGSDVVRYFFSMRSISSHMNFDIDLAKTE